MIVEFPEFLPDLPALENPGTTVAKNVVPSGASYKPFNSFVNYTTVAITGRVRGAISPRDQDSGASYTFTGNSTALYMLDQASSGIFTDVSKVGGYTLGTDDNWSFTQYGDYVIATSFTDNIQVFQLGTSVDFADLGGSPPKARYVDSVRDFLMVANTFDATDGFKPNRVRWPGIGTTTSWTVSATTQADYQDLDSKYGWITQLVGGDYALVFQEKAITRFDYVGSPIVFQVQVIETQNGTRFPNSVIKIGSIVYFIGIDGFYACDGSNTIPIGRNKVDRFFLDDFDATYEYLICTAHDPKNEVVMWAYPSSSVGGGAVNSRILFYNYSPNATKRWSYADVNTQFIFSALSQGYTLDGLDDWESAHSLSKNIDILPYSLDSRVWTGNSVLLGAINSSGFLSYSTGTPMDAVIETAEVQITEGQKTDVFLVKPIVQSIPSQTPVATVTTQIGTRDLQNATVTYGSALSLDANGHCQARSNARYHRLRVNITGYFQHAKGFELLEYQPAGYR